MRFENFVGGTYLDGLASFEDCLNFYPALNSFEDFQPKAVIQLSPRGIENSADRLGHTALPANDFTDIARGDPQLQNCNVLAFYGSDGDRFRDVNKGFRDVFDQLFHASRLLYSTWYIRDHSKVSSTPSRVKRSSAQPGVMLLCMGWAQKSGPVP
jgi:hypothetical protein